MAKIRIISFYKKTCTFIFAIQSKKNMLQRIQSLYLGLVVLMALLFLALPIGQFGDIHALSLIRIPAFSAAFPDAAHAWYPVALIAMTTVILILTLYAISRYRFRLVQLRMGKFNILLHLLLLVLAFFYLDQLREQLPGLGFTYGAGIFFPLFSLLLILMANRAIKRDEARIRAADRIR